MPKVLIMSDSHGLTEEIVHIKERHKSEVDQMVHCGDSELDVDAPELDDFMKVGGNMDFDVRFPEETNFTIEDLTFLGVHGHLHNVKGSMMQLSYRAQELEAQIVCFGHTHVAGAEKIGDLLFINPGSIRLPRQRSVKTYAIVSWEKSDNVKVDFYDTKGEIVEEMSYQTSLV